MLPLRIITGEAEARRVGGSRPPSVILFDAVAHSPYADNNEAYYDNRSPLSASTPRYMQPRSMPSPPLAYDSIEHQQIGTSSPPSSKRISSKLHGLGIFKHGLKTNLQISTSGHRSNPTSPLKASPVKSRRRSHSLFGQQQLPVHHQQTYIPQSQQQQQQQPQYEHQYRSSLSSSNSSRHYSSHGFSSEYGPKPPISPTPSSPSKSSPTNSPIAIKFGPGHSQKSSYSSSYRQSAQLQSEHQSPRLNLDNWTESYLSNKKTKSSRNRPQRISNLREQQRLDTMSESSQSEAGSPSYIHQSHPQSAGGGGGRAVFHYDLTPESNQGSFPSSPVDKRRLSKDSSPMKEVEQKKMVAPILQARLSSVYSRDTGFWSTRSGAYTSMTSINTEQGKYMSMEMDDDDDENELMEMMADMGSSETPAEKEVRMLMKEMLNGQEVVRKGGERFIDAPVPSPQLPRVVEEIEDFERAEERDSVPELEAHAGGRPVHEFDLTMSRDWKDIEQWAGLGSAVEYPRQSSIATYEHESEIEDESMDEEDYDQLEMQTAMANMSPIEDRSRVSMAVSIAMSTRSSRHPAENEGLNEMIYDPSFPMPEIPAQYEGMYSTPKQEQYATSQEEQTEDDEELEDVEEEEEEEEEEAEEFTLGTGVNFEDLDIIEEEMQREADEEAERIRQIELAKNALLPPIDSRPTTKDGSRPGTKEGLPQLSLLEVPPAGHNGKAHLESPSSGDESPIDIKGKAVDFSRGGRRHNLKENEIRVEDPAYLIAFKKFLKPSVHTDAFVCRQTRFDGFQTRRICNELPHEYRPLPPCPPKTEPEVEARPRPQWEIEEERERVLSMTPEQRRAKEVSDEITSRLWVFMAAKWLHYGRILLSPAHDILTECSRDRRRQKASGTTPPVRRRVLDLGGAPVADWGWHCAYEYPHSKVYTVTSRPKNINVDNVVIASLGVVEKRRFTGPSNHRHIKVSSLWKLPFPDNHFDVISARSLQTILKQHPPPKRRSERQNRYSKSAKLDEYNLTLKECYRVLKPGGHFEWSLTDSDVVRAGPAAERLAADFAHDLRSRGYDPNPTSRWINRIHTAGFVHTHRTWTVMPMAPPANKPKVAPKRQLGKSFEDDMKAAQAEMEAELKAWEELGVVKGSTKDIAGLTGILGTWKWEEWMVKVDAESMNPAGKKGLVNGITAALDESRENGSGWRSLVGWTRKPTKVELARMEKRAAR